MNRCQSRFQNVQNLFKVLIRDFSTYWYQFSEISRYKLPPVNSIIKYEAFEYESFWFISANLKVTTN